MMPMLEHFSEIAKKRKELEAAKAAAAVELPPDTPAWAVSMQANLMASGRQMERGLKSAAVDIAEVRATVARVELVAAEAHATAWRVELMVAAELAWVLQRKANERATQPHDTLHPLSAYPVRDEAGTILAQPPPPRFPPNVAAAHSLSATAAYALLEAYHQPTHGDVSQLRRRFCCFVGCGLPDEG